jgi:hypothetical protein
MRRNYLLITVTVSLFMVPSIGWAGTCPSGANYLNTSNPTGPLVTLSSMGITSCYYIAANGSDSNDGASEASGHPWAHAPGMPNCTANCASNSPAGGSGYIFRGGDTWHFGDSSSTPYTGGTWQWESSGASTGSPIYVGVDSTWFSGSSWARPILTGDNATSTSPVGSCSYIVGTSNILVYFSGVRYTILDNFELTGLCWNSASTGGEYLQDGGAIAGAGNPAYFQNLYMHGWTHTTAGTQGAGTGFQGYNQNYGETFQYNVIDGSDSDDLSLGPFGQGGDGYNIQYNVIRHAGGTSIFDDCHIIHDNLFEYINNVTDGSTHTDVLFCYSEYAGGSSNPNLYYNNIYRDIGTEYSGPTSGVEMPSPPAGQTDYLFNEVFGDYYANQANYNDICEGGGCGAMVIFNETAENGLPGYGGGCIWCNPSAGVTSITSVNNHWITSGTGTSAVFQTPSQVTETGAVYQTISIANGQGYTDTNNFAPTAATNATLTAAGTNETTGYCADSVLHNAAAEAACVAGTTDGCSYNSTSHTISCPDITAVARPSSGTWNVGAYQYSSSATSPTPNNPTNLTATVP